MVETIISYLNAKLEGTGYFHSLYCLVEKKKEPREEGDFVYPATYVGGGDLELVEFDSAGFAYFRKNGDFGQSVVANDLGQKQLYSIDLPFRLVAMVRRQDVVTDDAYSPDRLARELASILTFRNGDLRTFLQASRVTVTSGSWTTNPEQIWTDETEGTGRIEPDYSRAFIAMDVTVNVLADEGCIRSACTDEPDILRLFDFCDPTVIARLSDAQVTCLQDALCEACEDATVTVNTAQFGTAPSGGGLNVPVVNGGANPVGSKQGSDWVIANNATFINGTQVTDQEAEFDANIFVTLDGAQSGSWNAGTQTWEVTSEAHTISVAVSDTTPSTGDIITITTTPSGFTPNNHIFFSFDGSTIEIVAEQASGVYNWLVDRIGTYDIYVLASDGTIKAYGKVSIVSTSTFLLDQIASSPELAFSLRRLKASYVGNAATVRRSTDNATQAIGFVGENFDTASFISFVGVGNAFSAILYNQSMRFNATQPTAAYQPTMAIGGTISMLNGKPTIVFDTQGDAMKFTPIGSSHVFAVARAITINASQAQYICGFAGNGMGIAGTGVTGIFLYNAPALISTTIKDTTAHQTSFRCGLAGTARIRVDGTTQVTGTVPSMTLSAIGTNPGAGFASNLELSEFISFADNISDAEELVIEANQKAYYGTP